MFKTVIATLAVILFSFSLAFAGGDSGVGGSTVTVSATTTTVPSGGGGGGVIIPPTTGPRLSQLLMQKLLAETTYIGVNLLGPDIYWTEANIEDNEASINIDSGLVKPGRYGIYITLFGRDGNSTLNGSVEALLLGKDVAVDIQLMPPSQVNMKIYIPNYQPGDAVEWREEYLNGSSWGPREVKQDDRGYYIDQWVDGSSKITLTVGNSKFYLTTESLFGDYVDNGYALANNEEVFSNAEIQVLMHQGLIYPYDFPDMTLDEAIESVPTNSVITLVFDWYNSFKAKTGITIQGMAGDRKARIDNNWGPIEVVKNPETDEPLVLKNLVVNVYNQQSSGLHKPDDAAVTLDHVVIISMSGASAISGQPIGLKMNHCTLISDQGSSTALNFIWPQGNWNWQGTEIKNSIITGFKQVINIPLGIPAYNNLLWNNQDEDNVRWWVRTMRKDPLFIANYYPAYYPDIMSPVAAAADDGSYIGAFIPRQDWRN